MIASYTCVLPLFYYSIGLRPENLFADVFSWCHPRWPRKGPQGLFRTVILHCVISTGTMVTDGFPLGLVWFQDTSLVAVALLCMQEVSLVT